MLNLLTPPQAWPRPRWQQSSSREVEVQWEPEMTQLTYPVHQECGLAVETTPTPWST